MNVNIALNSFYVLKYTSKSSPIYNTILPIQPSLSLSLSLVCLFGVLLDVSYPSNGYIFPQNAFL